MTIEELVHRAVNGDKDAQGELYSVHYGLCFTEARKILGCIDDAMDVTQEAFILAFKHLNQLKSPPHFKCWVALITKRLCYSLLSQYASRKRRRPRQACEDCEPWHEETAESLFMTKEESRRLKSTIQHMRPNDRECILDFHFNDMSLNEMQQKYSIPLGTVKRRLHTARKRLAETLS